MSDPNPTDKPAALPPATGSVATLKDKIVQMRKRREWSSGHYSVRVDELYELLSILETIIEAIESRTEMSQNDQGELSE